MSYSIVIVEANYWVAVDGTMLGPGQTAETELSPYVAAAVRNGVLTVLENYGPAPTPSFNYQPEDQDLTDIANAGTTAWGRARLLDANAAATITALGIDNRYASSAQGAKADAAVPQVFSLATNQRMVAVGAGVYDTGFSFSKISATEDGMFTWGDHTITAGTASPITYFKMVGGRNHHSGVGNIDVFWSSLYHSGPREAGLFIGDLHSSGGGNAYGLHTRVETTVTPPVFTVAALLEVVPAVALTAGKTCYGLDIQNNGSQAASAAINIDAAGFTGSTAKFATCINIDSSAADASSTAMLIGGSWGSGINMNANTIVNTGSITGTGSSPNRDVRLVDNLLLDNARYIKMKDSGGTNRNIMSLTSTDNTRFILGKAAGQFEFIPFGEGAAIARITSSGRADFSTAGVTTKYTSGGTQPAYLTNGQIEAWHDTGSGNDYIVVNVNGVSKKALLS